MALPVVSGFVIRLPTLPYSFLFMNLKSFKGVLVTSRFKTVCPQLDLAYRVIESFEDTAA